jgi:hypothetical protein
MTNSLKPYDGELYALKTATLKKIAEQEGAISKIATATANVWSVAGELFTSEKEALTYAIEHNRRTRQKGGKAK